MTQTTAQPYDFDAPSRASWLKRVWRSFQPWNPLEDSAMVAQPTLTVRIRLGVLIRFFLVISVLGVMTLLLGRHVYHLQVTRHDDFFGEAMAICRSHSIQTAQRGSIFDRRGNLLAGDVATSDVFVEAKRFSKHLDEVTRIIARNLHLNESLLHSRLDGTTDYEAPVVLKTNASEEFVDANGLWAIAGVKVTQNSHAEEGKQVSYRVSFHPYALEEATRRHSLQELTRIFGLSEKALLKKCEDAHARGREITIAVKVPRDDAARMMRELREFWRTVEARPFQGVRVTDSWKRIYPLDCELANLLGYVNDVEYQPDEQSREGVRLTGAIVSCGISGIESLMNNYLRPTYGEFTYTHYNGGRPAEEGMQYRIRPQKGADVFLTIEEPIQQILEEELVKACEKHVPDHAYAIMMEPSTGAILAVAQYPQFNPNDRGTFAPENTRNHFISMSYEPGSIMKPISLSSVLESRQATLETQIDCEKGLWYYCGIPLRDSHNCGILTLSGVIEQSSNIGTAKFSVNLGGEAMYRHLRRFGLGERTGVGFYPPGKEPVVFRREDRGRFAEYRHWDKISITRFPIGQGLRVTPLQILQMWSALANHGVIMQPYIVDHVRYADGRTEYSQPQVKSQAIPAEVASQMTKALTQVTQGQHGTGKRAAIKGYKVAGKTGTAQLWINGDKAKGILGHYSNKDYFASFVGFVPAEQPRFLLLVSLDRPTKDPHSGGGAAAPVFKAIAARTLEYLQVPSDAESAQTSILGSAQR
ncbi:MAG: hypothetical protein IKO65_11260 [Victivallales bacterium]|nr:hypothetical protein [Victivallales bacterium]